MFIPVAKMDIDKRPGPHCTGLLNGPVLFFLANQGKSLSSLRVLLECTLLKVLLLKLDPKV